MEFAITLGVGGWIVLIAGALVFGGIAQLVGQTRTGYEWLIDAIAAAIGALVASEFIVAWQTIDTTIKSIVKSTARGERVVLMDSPQSSTCTVSNRGVKSLSLNHANCSYPPASLGGFAPLRKRAGTRVPVWDVDDAKSATADAVA